MDLKVIVTINETNADKYNALFAKAYQALQSAGKLHLPEDSLANSMGRFVTLNEYMGHASELLTLDPAYLLLPLDEPAFEINADARTIKASKIAVLQNDTNAETIQFVVDRYFDQMDLNEAQIFIQWTRPSGGEGATLVEMKDLTIPGKIRFGWTLTSDVTAEPGVVKYSVRFWNLDEDEVVYSLNTLTSSLTISPSLHPIVEDNANVVRPSGLFARAVRNSMISSAGTPVPLAPYFFAPGEDLLPYASLNAQDTLTLRAQAGVGDTGVINYEWYYKPATEIVVDGVTFRNDTFYPFHDVGEFKGFNLMGGTVSDEYIEYDWASAGKLNIGDRYFTDNQGKNPYTSIHVPEIGSAIKLYEKYTTYTVPADSSMRVTGQYKVCATNTIGNNTTAEHPSTVCQLISPDNVVITKDLPALVIAKVGDDLVVNVKEQTHKDKVLVTYKWEKSVKADLSSYETLSEADNTYTIATPGWYKATINANLNREPKTATTQVCKVTFAPEKPQLAYDEIALGKIPEDDDVPVFAGATAILGIAPINMVPSSYVGYDSTLFSDEITYRWTKRKNDGRETNVTDADVASGLVTGEINASTLVVNAPEENAGWIFCCYATNHLSGKTAESAPLAFYVH